MSGRKNTLNILGSCLIICLLIANRGYSETRSKGFLRFSDFRNSGFFDMKASFDTKKDNKTEDLWEKRSKLRLKTSFNDHKRFNILFSVQGEYRVTGRNGNKRDDDEKIDIYEGYISWLGDRSEFRVGKQIIFWGKTDEINPLDNLNPQDLKEYIIPDREERKIPIIAAKYNYYINNFIIEGVFIPFFKSNKLAEKGSDWELSSTPPIPLKLFLNEGILNTRLIIKSPHPPSRTLKNSEWGIRILKTMGEVEYSFSYFYTWDDNPIPMRYLQFSPSSTTDLIINPIYKRQHIWGFDFNTFFKRIGIRGEFAFLFKYFQTEDINDQDGIIKRPYLFYVNGIDYTFPNDLALSLLNELYINCQFSQKIIFNYNKFITEREYQNLLIFQLKNSYLSGDILKIDIKGCFSLDNKDYRINPEVSYDLIDAFKLSIGAEILNGGETTSFGQFDENDFIYVKIRYHFL